MKFCEYCNEANWELDLACKECFAPLIAIRTTEDSSIYLDVLVAKAKIMEEQGLNDADPRVIRLAKTVNDLLSTVNMWAESAAAKVAGLSEQLEIIDAEVSSLSSTVASRNSDSDAQNFHKEKASLAGGVFLVSSIAISIVGAFAIGKDLGQFLFYFCLVPFLGISYFLYSLFWIMCPSCHNFLAKRDSVVDSNFLGTVQGSHTEYRTARTQTRYSDTYGNWIGDSKSSTDVPVQVAHTTMITEVYFDCPVCSYSWSRVYGNRVSG